MLREGAVSLVQAKQANSGNVIHGETGKTKTLKKKTKQKKQNPFVKKIICFTHFLVCYSVTFTVLKDAQFQLGDLWCVTNGIYHLQKGTLESKQSWPEGSLKGHFKPKYSKLATFKGSIRN